jgi:outer membrane immunogenic protein
VKNILLAGVAVSALMIAQSGHAADKVAPGLKSVPVFSWSGCFVGAQVGWGWARHNVDQDEPSGAPILSTGGGETIIGFTGRASSSGHVDSGGGVFGGQIGCDLQLAGGNWVVGVQGTGLSTSITGNDRVSPFAVVVGGSSGGAGIEITTRWLASATVRLGFTAWSPQTLFYVRGGGAWTDIDYDLAYAVAGVQTAGVFDRTHNGWTAGVGVEWMFAPDWTAFVEYNHYEFAGKLVGIVNQFDGVTFTKFDSRPTIDTVSIGVNYRFNWGRGRY